MGQGVECWQRVGIRWGLNGGVRVERMMGSGVRVGWGNDGARHVGGGGAIYCEMIGRLGLEYDRGYIIYILLISSFNYIISSYIISVLCIFLLLLIKIIIVNPWAKNR